MPKKIFFLDCEMGESVKLKFKRPFSGVDGLTLMPWRVKKEFFIDYAKYYDAFDMNVNINFACY